MSRFRPSSTAPVVIQPAAKPVFTPPAPPVRKAPASTPPTASEALDSSLRPNPLRGLAIFFALAFLFVILSFIHEVIQITTGIRSYLPPLTGVPAIIGFLLTGGVSRFIRATPARWFALFVVWLAICAPLGVWRGGSMQLVSVYVQVSMLPLLFAAGLVITWREFKLVMYVIAAAGVFNEITARLLAEDIGGRLALDISIGNANDFAAHLLLILPIFWFISVTADVPRIFRFAMYPCIAYGLYLSLRTGSRGALVAMAVTYLFVTFRAKGVQRLVFATTVPLLAAILFTTMPGSVVNRLATIYQGEEAPQEAQASSANRMYLFRRSVELTVRNPLFGVGPGQFAVAEGGERVREGRTGAWMQTHNSYTQISSEAGVPGLILLLGALITAYRLIMKTVAEARRREGCAAVERAGFALMISFVCFCSSAAFLSLAYRPYFPLIVGLAIAYSRAAQHEFATQANAPAANTAPRLIAGANPYER